MTYRRLVYVSRATGQDTRFDHLAILGQSNANNGLNGVTGVLWTDGQRYLQVLEGTPEGVGEVFAQIARDRRHEDVRVLSDTDVPQRQFGGWTMASLKPGEGNVVLEERLRGVVADLPADVRAEYEGAIADPPRP